MNYQENEQGDNYIIEGDLHHHSQKKYSSKEITKEKNYIRIRPSIDFILPNLKSEGVVFLSGSFSYKKDVARYIAQRAILENEELSAYEVYIESITSENISDLIEKDYPDKKAIFLLQDIKPIELGYDYEDSLLSAIQNGKFFIIVANNIEKERLYFNKYIINKCWYTLKDKDLYHDIKDYLHEQIGDLKKHNSLRFLKDGEEQYLINKISSLDSVKKVELYLSQLATLINQKNVELDVQYYERIYNDINSSNILERWFDESLDDEERFLVIGLSAFVHMDTAQTFEVLDKVVNEAWRSRKVNLPYYDYKDLRRVSSYFQIKNENIEASDEELSDIIFNHCWFTYRRHLTSLLPVAINLVEESYKKFASNNKDLFGTKVKRDSLRKSITQFLYQIGKRSFQTVEPYLLPLIVSKNSASVIIFAKVTSSLYYTDKKDEILAYVSDILSIKEGTVYYTNVKECIVKKEEDNKAFSVEVYVNISIAYFLMYVNREVLPNKLPEEICSIFLKLIKNIKNDSNRRPEINNAIITIISYHYRQLYSMLNNLAKEGGFEEIIHLILIKVFSYNEQYVWNITNNWLDLYKKDRVSSKSLMLIALKTLYEIDNYKDNEELLFDLIKFILSDRGDIDLRNEAIITLMSLVDSNNKVVDNLFQEVVLSLNENELSQLTTLITNKYLEQRSLLSGGDLVFKFNNVDYDIWYNNTARPKTKVEKMLAEWLSRVKTKKIAQFAYLAETNFAIVFDTEAAEAIDRYYIERRYTPEPTTSSDFAVNEEDTIDYVQNGLHLKNTLYSTLISIPIGTIGYPKEKKVISAILPVVINQSLFEKAAIMKRFNVSQRDKLSLIIDKVLIWEGRKPLISILVIILFFLLLFVAG